jgi:hypothetical protein
MMIRHLYESIPFSYRPIVFIIIGTFFFLFPDLYARFAILLMRKINPITRKYFIPEFLWPLYPVDPGQGWYILALIISIVLGLFFFLTGVMALP